MEWLFLIPSFIYVYFLLRIYTGLKKVIQFQLKDGNSVFVSIIVACRNEKKNLTFLLTDIADQNYYPDQFEVIIVDDDSTDSTYEIASSFTRIKNFKVLRNNGKGKKKAIRTGVEASEGSLIITTDADSRMGKNWLKTIVSFYTSYNPEMIICPVMLDGSKGFLGRFEELEFLSLQGITTGTSMNKDPVMCNGANLAFKKMCYLKYSGDLHDELVSGDDVFLLHRIKKDQLNNILWLESSDAAVTTRVSGTIFSLLRQRARWTSKTVSYNDNFTIVLAALTFLTIVIQILLLLLSLFSVRMLLIFGIYTFLKSIPDYLILACTTKRYGKRNLMRWFLPSLIIYPFYVMSVVISSLVFSSKELN
jgi:biofilm PGA synthesis N-glycosyltransferase PgaC